LRETARDWRDRIDIHTAETDHRPADAILVRPDAHVARARASANPPRPPRSRCEKRSPTGSAHP
ncbi:MAG TPA: FAD-binding monooxygenase, partial [Trebonia sp.]|nr:FAD-binding monooxygenase [Trebonia sp.]